MKLEIFLEQFRGQFDETSPDQIQLDTIYKDIEEWSSMMNLIIIAFVDEVYNHALTGDDFKNTSTVEDLYNLIKSKL